MLVPWSWKQGNYQPYYTPLHPRRVTAFSNVWSAFVDQVPILQNIIWSNNFRNMNLMCQPLTRIAHRTKLKSTVCWDITPCSLLIVNWHFRRKFFILYKNFLTIVDRDCMLIILYYVFILSTYFLQMLRDFYDVMLSFDMSNCIFLQLSMKLIIIITTYHLLSLPPAFMLILCLAYSSTLKMEALCSFKIAVDFQRTAWHYIRR
jgi:hypothetical protein